MEEKKNVNIYYQKRFTSAPAVEQAKDVFFTKDFSLTNG